MWLTGAVFPFKFWKASNLKSQTYCPTSYVSKGKWKRSIMTTDFSLDILLFCLFLSLQNKVIINESNFWWRYNKKKTIRSFQTSSKWISTEWHIEGWLSLRTVSTLTMYNIMSVNFLTGKLKKQTRKNKYSHLRKK